MTTKQLYHENGVEITTHSMLKQWAGCKKATQYKYVDRLKKRLANERDKPLRRGTWMHLLFQEYYAGRDWKAMHTKLSQQFGQLFDEEREALGDLPRECAQLMRSYLWHYGANKDDPMHGWDVLEVEKTLECAWPDAPDGDRIYRGRVDLLVRDEFGLWIVDHKTHKTLPDTTFRLLDPQSALYIWAAWENGLEVRGFIWNYVRTKVPTVPTLAYEGKANERLSVAAIDTDYPTYYLGLKALGRLDDPVGRAKLRELRSHRYEFGKVQTSTFFRREILEKDEAMVARVVGAAMRSRDAMHAYDFGVTHPTKGDNYIRESVERSTGRPCQWCDYKDLCTTDLFGGNSRLIRKQQFRVGDPMDYYQDQKDTELPASV